MCIYIYIHTHANPEDRVIELVFLLTLINIYTVYTTGNI